MAWLGVPPFRPDTLCAIRSHLGPYVFLSHMATLHPLPKAMGTTAYHKGSLHGSHLFGCLFPIILILHARSVFRSDQGLLRSFRNCKLFLLALRIYCTGFT